MQDSTTRNSFLRPFVKRITYICYRTVVLSCPACPVCHSVCNVGVLWPNGWMDKMKLGMQVGLGPSWGPSSRTPRNFENALPRHPPSHRPAARADPAERSHYVVISRGGRELVTRVRVMLPQQRNPCTDRKSAQ